MAYFTDINRTLTVQITKVVTLNRHQLAGYLANLEFSVSEVRHCLDVIDAYNRSFEQMKAAQARRISGHGTVDSHESSLESWEVEDEALSPQVLPLVSFVANPAWKVATQVLARRSP